MGHNALEEERKQVNQQAMKTPGRKGEIIKNEEIAVSGDKFLSSTTKIFVGPRISFHFLIGFGSNYCK